MESIYILGCEGKTKTMYFPSANFENVKISELKSKIHGKTGIGAEDQRLISNGRELYDVRDGNCMTFKDYYIRNHSNITLTSVICGGGFLPLRFADITSKDKFKTKELSKDAPKWRIIARGLNFLGICKKPTCVAYNHRVWVMKGFYDSYNGSCVLNSEITRFKCPMCNSTICKKDVTGLGIYKCRVNVKCKQEDKDEISYDIVADKFEYAGCLKEEDKLEYEFIELIVKPLEDLSLKDVDLVQVE